MLIEAKRDNRTTPERQAAKALGVVIAHTLTEVRSVYGQNQKYAQIFVTKTGDKLVIVADSNEVSATIKPASFDWDEDIANDGRNYRNIADAAGLDY